MKKTTVYAKYIVDKYKYIYRR